jgi:ABC-type dipeptide/oligopeptide/nickel transport system permease component
MLRFHPDPPVSWLVPTFIGMTLLAFFLIRLVPGDPIETMAGERGIDPERHAQLRAAYGFDKPVIVQYGIYIGRVLHGDLGKSIITQDTVMSEFSRCSRPPWNSRCAPFFSRCCWACRPASWRRCGATPSSTTA